MNEIYEVIVTAPEYDWMTQFIRQLVNDRLIASGNIIRDVFSIYRWQGEVVERPEVIGLLHTRLSLVERVIARIVAEHPYEVPGIRVAALKSTGEYAQWVMESTRQGVEQ